MSLSSSRNKYFEQILVLIVLSYFFLMLGNSSLSLTNPDEVFYSQTAKEMIQQKTWMTPYLFGQPQFEKPILTYWLLRLAFLFDISSFSARFFPALFGMFGVIGIYAFGLAVFKDSRRAMWSAIVLMSSSLYIGLARTVFTDLFFTIFIFFSLAAFYWGYLYKNRKAIGLILAFLASGLAVLTKGPLGFLIPGFAILLFLIIKKDIKFLLCRSALAGFSLFLLVSLPWYIFMVRTYGSDFIKEFFYNDHVRRLFEAEHKSNDTWFFYPASIIGCMMPWGFYTIGAIAASITAFFKKRSDDNYLFFFCWIISVFFFFQPAHSKLVSYIFPLFPPIALIVGDYIAKVLQENRSPSRFFIFSSWATTILFLILPAGLMYATIRFSEYVISRTPVYMLDGFLLLYCLTLIILLFKKRYIAHTAIVSAILPILLYFAFIVHDDFDAYASSKGACELLAKQEPKGKILVSKFFARGVRFFTDGDVVVMDISGSGYFSPHPVLYLNSSDKVEAFLQTQPQTYAVLKKGTFKDLKNIASKNYELDIINVCGDEYVVKISPRS